MGRRVVLDDEIGGWDVVISEPQTFTLAANAADLASHGLRWLLPRLAVVLAALVGAAWLILQAVWFAALGVVVFVAIPAVVVGCRWTAIAYRETGGL